MATKKQEVLLEEQAPMGEATPQTEGNPELEEMHDATDAESPPPQTGTETSETDGNSADPGISEDSQEALSQTETEEKKKTRGRKKTAEKSSESDAEADSDDKNAGDGVEETPKPRRRRASARPKAVVSIDENPTVETEADKAKNDLLDLLESQKTGRILTGTIQGVERPADNPSRSLAVIYHGEFKVMIPAEEAVEPPADYRGRLPEDVLHYMLTKRLGAEVDYIVKGIDPKSGLAVASRLEAMKSKRKAYYLGTDRDGNNLLYSGVCAEARIVSVIRAGIFVDLFGLEIYIPLRELSYQRWMDAAAYFQPGQRILVKVLEVDRSDRNQIKATASVKQAGENPYEKALRRYSVGNRYVGTVSMVDTNGVFVALDGGIDCLCSYPKRGRPPRGSRVTVRILGINNDSNRIWGAITHIAAAR
ncbi:S1 RNA-binding domain-containing protein [uncultured Acetatifactor sp.]|uniref:S1 RNA-binding domain-containing protein n=1 Tax=uncultured Acetatifactor sp. TaxID=1671927 RepID=UPI00260802DA|nr:S1 RNA-binding domain-containing protein [uncultured Acetatifactor sp.]